MHAFKRLDISLHGVTPRCLKMAFYIRPNKVNLRSRANRLNCEPCIAITDFYRFLLYIKVGISITNTQNEANSGTDSAPEQRGGVLPSYNSLLTF